MNNTQIKFRDQWQVHNNKHNNNINMLEGGKWEVEKDERCRVGGNDNFSFIHSSGWKSVLEVGVALKWKINQICDAQ